MKKVWYLIYVKEKKELKVSSVLNSKHIENFCPFNLRQNSGFFQNKTYHEPLLPGYIFSRLEESEIDKIKQMRNVISFVYWKNELITVPDEYITTLRRFCNKYRDITVKRFIIEKTQEIKPRKLVLETTSEIILPKLGYSMVADINKTNNNLSVIIKQSAKKSTISL